VFKNETVKHFVQCHVFAHSPPGRRLSDKYPVNTSHRSWCVWKMFHSQYCLVATVILI
jgi:hypothetical protein